MGGFPTTSSSTAISPVLTGLFYNIVQDGADYAGLEAAPARPIAGTSAQYAKRTQKSQLNLDQTDEAYDRTKPVGRQAPSRPSGIDLTSSSVTLQRYADHVFVDEATADDWLASGDIDVLNVAVEDLVALTHDVHEYHAFVTIYGTSGSFAATTDPGNYSTSSTDLITPVNAYRRAIRQSIRRSPTKSFINEAVRDALILQDQVRAYAGQMFQSASGAATVDMLKAFWKAHFNMDLVIVPGYYENSSGADTAFFGNHIAMAYLAADASPSFCNTFVRDNQLPGGMGQRMDTIARIYDKVESDPIGMKVIADTWWKIQVENSGAGRLLTDVLS